MTAVLIPWVTSPIGVVIALLLLLVLLNWLKKKTKSSAQKENHTHPNQKMHDGAPTETGPSTVL